MKIQPWQIKTIKSAQTALGMDDAAYRLLLSGYGVTSSTRLNADQARDLIAELRAKAVAAGIWQDRPAPTRKQADDKQSRKIRALWLELHQAGKVRDASEKALCSYVQRMTGTGALQWCSSGDKRSVIESLKRWLERPDKAEAA